MHRGGGLEERGCTTPGVSRFPTTLSGEALSSAFHRQGRFDSLSRRLVQGHTQLVCVCTRVLGLQAELPRTPGALSAPTGLRSSPTPVACPPHPLDGSLGLRRAERAQPGALRAPPPRSGRVGRRPRGLLHGRRCSWHPSPGLQSPCDRTKRVAGSSRPGSPFPNWTEGLVQALPAQGPRAQGGLRSGGHFLHWATPWAMRHASPGPDWAG